MGMIQCDMVLIAGDLFHENKPSRRTMHKAMEIIRRYCMGPNPVQIQIISDQATNFRSVHGTVNYEDQFYSVGEYYESIEPLLTIIDNIFY